MSEWRETTLGEVGAFVRGKRFTKNDYVDSGLGCIHYGQMYTHFGSVARETLTFIPKDMRSRMRLASPGDVVVAATSENTEDLGKATAWLGTDDIAVHDDCYIFKHHLDPTFASYVFASASFDEQKVQYAAGTKVTRISGADLAKIEIALPSLDEQQRIVDVVASVDAQIEALEAEVIEARRTATRMRSHMFAGLDCPTIPAGEMFDMLLGRQKSDRQAVGDHVLPYLRSGNVTAGALAVSDVLTMNFEPHEQVKYGLRPDDIMLTEGGTPGQAARWNGEIEGVVGFDKHVIRLRARPEVSISEFALQWCHWSRESGAFDAQATGITIKALGFGRASAMPVPTLNVKEQTALVAPLAALDGEIASLVDELASLRAFRSTLLTALLSQTISIPESYDALLDAAPSALEGALA